MAGLEYHLQTHISFSKLQTQSFSSTSPTYSSSCGSQLSSWQTIYWGAYVKTSPIYRNREFRKSQLYSLMPSAHHLFSPRLRLQKLPHHKGHADFRHIAHSSPPAGLPSHPDTPLPSSSKDNLSKESPPIQKRAEAGWGQRDSIRQTAYSTLEYQGFWPGDRKEQKQVRLGQ